MSDLINRADAISVLEIFTQTDTLGHTPKQIVEALPSAQPEWKKGKWISVFDIGTVCNKCGYDIEEHGFDVRTDGEPNYCPNCGAKMDGKEKANEKD